MNEERLNQIAETQVRMEEQIKTLFKQQADIKALTETVQRLAVALEKQGMALQMCVRFSRKIQLDVLAADADERALLRLRGIGVAEKPLVAHTKQRVLARKRRIDRIERFVGAVFEHDQTVESFGTDAARCEMQHARMNFDDRFGRQKEPRSFRQGLPL